ncbi:hypothetical protein MTR67_042870 [Solanum verrucosum]|uniref:Uncharacterized protein n=1 Tax=Solanum verrucosum TaxID=315347 RepID=A0AAF0UPA1_SOLVR|nr:hypothetical protein MTR67_042870 [Solanum verrucosum]
MSRTLVQERNKVSSVPAHKSKDFSVKFVTSIIPSWTMVQRTQIVAELLATQVVQVRSIQITLKSVPDLEFNRISAYLHDLGTQFSQKFNSQCLVVGIATLSFYFSQTTARAGGPSFITATPPQT